MRAHVPTSLVDNEYELFPEGTFAGELASAERQEYDDGERITIRAAFANTRGLGEDAPETNGRTFTGEIPVRHGGQSVTEIADFSNSEIPFPLRLGAGWLAGLAEAVGAATRDEETGVVDVDFAEFLEALQDGEFKDREVAFEVRHRTYENNDGEEVETDDFRRIGPAG